MDENKTSVWVVEELLSDDDGNDCWVAVDVAMEKRHAEYVCHKWVSRYPHRVCEYVRKEEQYASAEV